MFKTVQIEKHIPIAIIMGGGIEVRVLYVCVLLIVYGDFI